MAANWQLSDHTAAVKVFLLMLEDQRPGHTHLRPDLLRRLEEPLTPSRRGGILKSSDIAWLSGYPPVADAPSALRLRGNQLADEYQSLKLFHPQKISASPGGLPTTTTVDPPPPPPEAVKKAGGPNVSRPLLPPPPKGKLHPKKLTITTVGYARDERVVEWALKFANDKCELCGKLSPFVTEDEKPYREVHHVKRLADGGTDTTTNVAALCPGCHRRLHHGKDREKQRNRLYGHVDRLKREP